MIWSLEPIRKHFQPGLKFVTFMKFQNLKSYRMLVSVKMTKKALKTCFGVYKYVDISSEMKTKHVSVDSHGYGKLTLNIDTDVMELKLITHHQSDRHEETLSPATRPGLAILPEHYLGVVGSSLKFQIVTKSSVKGPLWYSITSRGSEISGGKCSDGSRFSSSFTCSLMIEPNFYPAFQLLFYHVKSDGVVMSDSVHIKVRGNPTKKFFSISKDKRGTYKPGEKIQFTLRSHGSPRTSVVHIMAIDEAIQKSQSGFDITMHDIQSLLNGIVFSGTQKYETINLEGGKKSKKSEFSKYPKTCKDPCTSSPCKNQGKCIMKSYNDFKCKCRNFYYGNLCEKYKSPWILYSKNINVPRRKVLFSISSIPGIFPGRRPKVIPGRGSLPVKKIQGNLLNRIPDATTKRLYFPKTWIWEDVNMRLNSSISYTRVNQ
ncbi:uncharacterized protein LOC134270440 [Saccostrea cucullata]|uniref:uncharacterized protein LOC134270440 n=1 Tax=Saccostrea cuccullata TaxID=36930 RepID=UPI002ED1FF18